MTFNETEKKMVINLLVKFRSDSSTTMTDKYIADGIINKLTEQE